MEIYSELKQLVNLLSENDIPFALCGGLAMAVYGMPRATIDIDIMIEEKNLQKVKNLADNAGFSHSPGKMNFRGGKIEIVRLVKFDQEIGDELILDLILVTPRLREIWDQREKRTVDWGELSVVSRDGLIRLKEFRGSGTDKDDIKYLKGEGDEG
ncbi:MAG: hypothetical protein V1789_12905 [PVC group bacterium]